jgi:hypothetical protein
VAALAAAGALVAGACSDDSGSDDGGAAGAAETTGGEELTVTALSTRPEIVSGGDVLVQVTGAAEDVEELAVTADGEEVSSSFQRTDDGPFVGLVSGLPDGESVIEVRAGDATGTLTVTNHPVTGPVFSGPHLEPFACTTEQNGLGAPLDEDCSAETVLRWSYVDADGAIQPLDDPAQLPPDVATTEIDGETVPLVIRTESGTIDRGVYWIHVLDPDPASERWETSAWNGTLVYRFGGGCGTSYSQGSVLGDGGAIPGAGFDLALLRAGYAQATNTLNTFQVQCNDVLSAEALAMTKERFVEGFGVPTHTVGEGGSGGAIQQYLIAQNYPGLLDAVVAALPFPDALSIAPGVVDCGLLERYYGTPAGAGFTEEQRAAVNGHLTSATCGSWASTFLSTIDPTTGCSLPDDQVYDPETNPDGARCTLQDSNVNLFGTDPDTGFARRPLDNVGVQYGLQALRDGVISVDQFLDLNESIGGYDIDGRWVPERMEADPDEIAMLFETGRINTGGGDLRQIPVLTLNLYTDPLGDIHDRFRAFTLLERLRGEDGERAPNAVLWTYPAAGNDLVSALLGTAGRDLRLEMVGLAVEWLDNLDEPAAERTPEDLAAARPAGAADVCVTPDGTEHTGGDELYEDGTPCAEAYPVRGDPRTAAGLPIESLIGTCTLVEPDPDAYGVPFTAEQEDRLREVFPDGVCDYGDRGPGFAELEGTWLDYSDGPQAD